MPRSLPPPSDESEPIVITGIGMIASVGRDRESVWRAVRRGQSGVRSLRGLEGIPDDLLIGAPVDVPVRQPGELKAITLLHITAAEALADSRVNLEGLDLDRFACAISGHMGDTGFVTEQHEGPHHHRIDGAAVPWWQQWMPNTGCSSVANRYGLRGPRICHSTACASGLIDVLAAVRAIRDGQADIALAGSAEGFHPLFAAGFHRMGVLAQHEDPAQACRPFDSHRSGFVMGEGSGMFVVERLSHALARRARIYAQVAGGKMLAEAHHVTGLDEESAALERLITDTLVDARMVPDEVGYINAHGTGTQQNDVVETRGIRRALGSAADSIWVSATKSMLGHLVNAAGSVELAITALALRDGFAPPTMNLTDQDPQCDLDCIPLVGRAQRFESALKLSVAFGGHLAAVALRRWTDAETGFPYPAAA
ncbi:MAG: beta-ketoacyl-[acyl-carrier-protein] synthase family protein [Planctomycetia bacterium]|nr:beta-ketoacyl-[acyl-carrier-protein] synthase family protein [Planctomycetia bacterium]